MSRSLLLVLPLAGGGTCLALGACGQAVKHEAAKAPTAAPTAVPAYRVVQMTDGTYRVQLSTAFGWFTSANQFDTLAEDEAFVHKQNTYLAPAVVKQVYPAPTPPTTEAGR